MKFAPTYDYGQTDLSIEDNRILWNFGELIKTLITISSNADRQKNIIGLGAVADEMAIDFESYFTLSYDQYLEKKLLNKESLEELISLDTFFDERSGDKDPCFWDDSLLGNNEDWNIARMSAKRILILMGMDDLDIEYNRSNICDGERIIGQQTIIQLVRK